MRSSSSGDQKWLAVLMFGLLYPAVLGSFFFGLLPELLQILKEGSIPPLQGMKLLLSSLLVLFFIFDFYFAQQVASGADKYPAKVFVFDLLTVLIVFVANDSVHLDRQGVKPEVNWIAGAMCTTYCVYLLWAYTMRSVVGAHASLFTFECIASLAFLFIVAFQLGAHVLAAVLFVTNMLFIMVAIPIVGRFNESRRVQSSETVEVAEDSSEDEDAEGVETANPAAPADQKAPLPGR